MRFTVDPNTCTECGRCIMACSLAKTGRIQPQESRISIVRCWPEVPEIKVCRFEDCPEHPCIEACQFDAINIVDGKVLISDELCRGCKLCVPACPYNAITMNNKKAVKCDLCGGNPACVAECVTSALTYSGVK
jgi:anaerobic carbon-monoxide dehydrogenase iron sulfur subunit